VYRRDRQAVVWAIPAERMKTRRAHRVPLTDATVNILVALPHRGDNPYLFPGVHPGRSLSSMALLLLSMGYGVNGDRGDYVPHSFRDWSGEVSSFPRDVAEMALAHGLQPSRNNPRLLSRQAHVIGYCAVVSNGPGDMGGWYEPEEGDHETFTRKKPETGPRAMMVQEPGLG